MKLINEVYALMATCITFVVTIKFLPQCCSKSFDMFLINDINIWQLIFNSERQ